MSTSSVLELPTPAAVHLEQLLDRDATSLRGRERRAEALLVMVFAVAAATLGLVEGVPALPHWSTVLGCVVLMAAAMHVRFDLAGGFCVPTQLGFVPLLFVCPPALVPPAVLVAVVVGRVPAVLSGALRPSRLLLCVPNCLFSLGPAVLLAALEPDALARQPVAVLALCLLAQVAVDLVASTARDAYELDIPVRDQLSEAAGVYLVDAVLTPTGYLVALAGTATPLAPLCVLPLLALLGAFARERRARFASVQELHQTYRGTAAVLGDVIEADDYYTAEHSREVVDLALAAGARLGLDRERLRDLEFAALLHDVGKVAIPKSVINKPGKLDEAEWELVKTHTVTGQQMLERVGGSMRHVGRIVRSHHERWDGGGYPDRLRAQAIPLEARIVSCCDAYNAMTTNRPYRPALSAESARTELRACRGTQFDPAVVDALLAVV